MIANTKLWNDYVEKNTDPYGKACLDVAHRVMELLDTHEMFDASALIRRADEGEGLTLFMAGMVASIVSQVHSRGNEFRISWNRRYGVEEESGVVNPAIIEIKGSNEEG